jgi:SAM-dependent methyltransferase
VLAPSGFVVGVDRTLEFLRPGSVNTRADRLPFKDRSFATVLAADLFHHLDDERLAAVLAEVDRVMRADGRLVGWWYEHTSDRSPDAPRHPRGFDAFVALAQPAGFRVEALELVVEIPGSPTVGVSATR